MKFKKLIKSLSVLSLVGVMVLSSVFVTGGIAQAQTVPSSEPYGHFWNPFDNAAAAVSLSGDAETLYVGGSMNSFDKESGGGFFLRTSDGQYDIDHPLQVTGTVNASVTDGNGGWYIAGDITEVNGVEVNGIAHILANGSVDQAFDVEVAGGSVLSAAYANNTLYIGGTFNSVDGQTRNRIASINTNTKQVTAWNPNIVGTRVNAIVARGSSVFVGGNFTMVNGQTRNSAAEINTSTGVPTAWNPNFQTPGGASGTINAIVVDSSENLVYLGGVFNFIGGGGVPNRRNIVAVNISTGAYTSWAPSVPVNTYVSGSVNAMSLDSEGNILYAAVDDMYFGQGYSDYRAVFAPISTVTGELLPWTMDFHSARIKAIHFDSSNDRLYVAGNFINFSGQESGIFVAFDANTQQRITWPPSTYRASGSNPGARTFSIDSGSGRVFVGGESLAPKIYRDSLVAFDVDSGTPTDFEIELNTNGSISNTLIDHETNTLYISGSFTTVNGQARHKIASINLSTGQLTSWNPIIAGGYQNSGGVGPMVLDRERNLMYIGGSFTSVGGQSRRGLAAVDLTTGQPNSWNPGVNNPGDGVGVYALVFNESGSIAYVGGSFNSISGQTRSRIAAIDTTTGQVTPWNPLIGGSGAVSVSSIELDESNNIAYVGGSFGTFNGQTRQSLAAIDLTTGQPTEWSPTVTSTVSGAANVYAMELNKNTNNLYIGGFFTTVNGETRNRLASFDTVTGALTSWNPNIGPASSNTTNVGRLVYEPSQGMLYVAGAFNSVGGVYEKGFASFIIDEEREESSSCTADFNGDGFGDNEDLFDFLSAWFAGDMDADMNHSNSLEVSDIFAFLSSWYQGC